MQDESDLRQRMLRQVEAAAAAAVLNGCDPDEVRGRVDIGIAEAAALSLRSPSQPPVRERAGRLNTLDSWVRAG